MDEDEVRSGEGTPGDEDFLVFSSGQRVSLKMTLLREPDQSQTNDFRDKKKNIWAIWVLSLFLLILRQKYETEVFV